MLVEFVGHAGVVIDSGQTQLLMDGWFTNEGAFDASWFQFPCNHHFADRDWSRLSAVIVSHEHLDHLDPHLLRSLPPTIPLYVVSYGSPLFVRKLRRLTGRTPKVLAPGTAHLLGDIQARIWIEESPINQDSVWAFRHGDRSLVHTVDSRLTPSQVDEVLEFAGGEPDLLLVQCSGASWYPLVYENYDQATKQSRALVKREQKLSYALSVAKRMRPKAVACVAGPPVFLDPILKDANRDPSFPTPGESQAWLSERGCPGKALGPLPGDRIDLASGEVLEDRAMHERFSWQSAAQYIERYAAQMAPQIQRIYAHAEGLVLPDVDAAVRAHFERMLSLSPYFNERINMTVCFDVQGEGGGCWLVDFGAAAGIRRGTPADPHQYRYRFHSRWLKRILVEDLPWEDFFLSLRFSAYRQPDVYNDHLLGLLKFNEAGSLQAVERYEKSMSSDSIVVTTPDGASYEIARYCPHAGASMEGAPIEGRTITCLNHHYVFDLETGECLTGNCRLRTRRVAP